MKELFELWWTFFKIGAFTFGGGYAMISLIQKETVENKKWITDEDILDIIAIAESTPGPIAINSATFVGFRVAGFWGSFFATLGMVMPSELLNEFSDIKAVQYAFYGIRSAVLALIIKAMVMMYKKSPKGIFGYFIMIFALLLTSFLKFNVLFVIFACALFGLLSSFIAKRRGNK